MNNIGTNIMIIRDKEGVSQEELADKLGVSRQTVYKWESGLSQPSIENIQKLAEIFGCTMDIVCKENLTADEYEQARLVNSLKNGFGQGAKYFNIQVWDRIHRTILAHADEIGVDKELLVSLIENMGDQRAIYELIYKMVVKFREINMSDKFIVDVLISMTKGVVE